MIHWEKEALTVMKKIFDWYLEEMGTKAADKFNRQSLLKMNMLVK